MERGGKISAQSTSSVSVITVTSYQRKIWLILVTTVPFAFIIGIGKSRSGGQ